MRKGGEGMTKLKPCPFCEGTNHFVHKAERYDTMGELKWNYALSCMNCELHGPLLATKGKAEKAWNLLPRKEETK